VYGPNGSGLIEESGIAGDALISVNTAGKALGVAGAFVAGPDWAIEHLIQRARPFVFSTAPPPAVAAAIEASLTVIAAEPERRRELARLSCLTRQRLREANIPDGDGSSQIIPVVLGDNDRALRVAEALQSAGFDVRAIRPPTVPPGTARLRISINMKLGDAVIDRFVEALAGVLSACAPRSSLSGAAPNERRPVPSDAG
jgi:8-amino-7-oxononanoate synthase